MAAGRPREFDYDQALESAMRVFWRKGFEGTSMPDLTDAMHMNRPSIYAAFGNKEELFRKALERYTQQSIEKFRERLNSGTVHDAVEAFLCMAVSSYCCKETPAGCMAVQGALVGSDDTEGIRADAAAAREQVVTLLKERFDRGVAEGELPKDTQTCGLARFFATVQQGMSVQSASGTCEDELQKIVDQAMKVLPAAA